MIHRRFFCRDTSGYQHDRFAQEPNRVLLSPAVSESLHDPLTDWSRLESRTRTELSVYLMFDHHIC